MKHGLSLSVPRSMAWQRRIGLLSHSEGVLLGHLALLARQETAAFTPQATLTPPQMELKILVRQQLNFTLSNFLKQFKTLCS